MNYLENHAILNNTQNGFRKNKSTIRACYQTLCEIIHSLNNKEHTVAIGLDLSKAFDSVDHDVLIEKLEKYGIRGNTLQLLTSYLRNRMQCVVETDSNGELLKSESQTIKRGVPQGSVLGPLMYIIYTNDLPTVLDEYTVQYADDCSIIISTPDQIVLEPKVFSALDILEKYYTPLNLRLNKDKTQSIAFSNSKSSGEKTFTNGTITLNTVSQISFLGITIDSRLDWKSHTDQLAKNVAKYCYLLKVLSQNINVEAAYIAYHAYVESRIRYGIIFWGGTNHIYKIFVLQKKCLRNILNIKQTVSCKPLFREQQILTLISQYIYEAVIFIVKNMSLFADYDRFHLYDTRNKNDLLNIKANFTYVQRNIPFSIIKIYNKLPEIYKNQPLKKLKENLRATLLEKAYYTLDEYFDDTL